MIDEKQIAETLEKGLEKVVKDVVPEVVKNEIKPVAEKVENLENDVKEIVKSFNVGFKSETTKHIEKVGNFFKSLVLGKTLNEATPADGGYLVPPEFEKDVVRVVEEYGVARKYARKIPMGTNVKKVNALTGSVTAYIVGEGQTITQSTPQFGQKELRAIKIGALIEATNELIDDSMSAVDVFNLILQEVAVAFARKEDEQTFLGDPTTGFAGVINDPDVEVYQLDNDRTSITKITGDDFIKVLYNKQSKYWKARNPRWFMHPSVFGVVRQLKDSNGNYIVGTLADGDKTPTILGIPVEFVDVLPSVAEDGADKDFIVFGDLYFYGLGIRKGLTAEYGYITGGFEADKKALRVTERVGGVPLIGEAFTKIRTAASS